jgi:hypothetical protein
MAVAFFVVDIDDLLTDYVNRTVHKPMVGKENEGKDV